MRRILIPLVTAMGCITSANAQVSLGLGIRSAGISIGVNISSFPDLIPVPGYPVYYDPRLESNYFFYDGLYWVYERDNWYASSWYDGPWDLIDPYYVPVYVLRVPVRYYRSPPLYFANWRDDAPPRWADHWGRDWNNRRRGWDQWDPRSAPRPAPLPTYQRDYAGKAYPRAPERQVAIRSDKYRYQPGDSTTKEYWQQQDKRVRSAPEPQSRPDTRQRDQAERAPAQQQQRTERTPEQQQRNERPQQQQRTERAPEQRERSERPQQQPERAEQPQPRQQQSRPDSQRAEPEGKQRDDEAGARDQGRSGEPRGQGKGREKQDKERGNGR